MKPEMRQKLSQLPFEEKIRMVGELIRLHQKVKTENVSKETALLTSLDKAAALARESRELTRKESGSAVGEAASFPSDLCSNDG